MANFHVVPRGDAIKHNTLKDKCQCGVEIRTANSDDRPGTFDVWFYHRIVTLSEAVLEIPQDTPPDPYADYRVEAA